MRSPRASGRQGIVHVERPEGVTAKDIIPSIIATIGANGGAGHAIECAGSAIPAFDMSERLTVFNMSIGAGAR